MLTRGGSNDVVQIISVGQGGCRDGRQDCVAAEEPLEIRIGDRPVSITMRTPGYDRDLAAGFLFTEGIVTDPDQISDIRPDSNVVRVDLRAGEAVDARPLDRNFYMTSSCGVCGKASLDALRTKSAYPLAFGRPVVAADVIQRLPDILRKEQAIFDRTGGLHASSLFDTDGRLLSVREDVGRHNALDKLIGSCFLSGGLPLNDRILLVSGRASFELIQKAAMAGIPIFAAVGAPSSLAVVMGADAGMTLLGFVRDGRFNIYCGEERIA